MLYLLYRIGAFLALTLPIKIAYRIADISGTVYYFLAKRDRKIVTDNIKVVLNHSENIHKISKKIAFGNNSNTLKGTSAIFSGWNEIPYHKISRHVFINFARYLVEFFRTPRLDLKYIEKHIKIEGRENLDKALDLGKGAVLLSAHLGNWELGAAVLSMLGYKINIIAWAHKNSLINNFFLQQRQSKGITVIPLGAGVRKAFSALKNNEIVALLGDIDYTKPETGIKVKLFGRDTILPKGPAVFSLKTAAPIVPIFLLREKANKFRFVLSEPIIFKPFKNAESDSANAESNLIALTEKVAKVIELYVARYPGQWFMLTPRWQTNR